MNREHVLEILFPRQEDQRRENDGHHHHADDDGDIGERYSEDGGTGGPCRIDELRFASEMREERDEDAETGVATSLDVDADVDVASAGDRPPKEAHPLSSRPRTKRTASPPGREKEPKDRRSISPMCVICLERIGNSQMVSGLCQHRYHYDCLMEWMKKSHNDCPTCRQLLWDEGAFQDILREHNGGDAVIHTENPTTSQPHQPQQSQEQPGRRRRRRMERAGFPWRILCYVVNILMFIAGAGYLVASLVMGNGNNNNNNSRIDMDMEDSLCNQVGLRASADSSNVGMLASCEGSWACLEADPCVSIGVDSCNGEEACERLRVNVGNNSCQGPRACKGPLVNIGDNACIGIEACACRRPMEGIPGFNYDDDVPAGRCATQDECCLLADPLT